MAEQSYLEQVAALRQQRAQQEAAERVEQLKSDYQSNIEMRNEAAQRNDADDWHYWDRECEQNEREWLTYFPPQRPQQDPRWVNFALRNKPFWDRHGQRGDYVIRLADAYLTRPKIRGETNPGRTGMGLQRYSPAYFDNLKSLLEMHGKDYGVTYSRDEEALTPDGAAKASGLSARDYNASVQQLQAQGRLGQD